MVWSSFLLSAPSWDMIGIKNSRHPPSQSNTNQIIVFCLPFFLALCFSHVVFNQIWRALRLIVDTGLHYYPNFTREDALSYFDKFAWDNTDLAQKEVSFFHRVKQEVSSIFSRIWSSILLRYCWYFSPIFVYLFESSEGRFVAKQVSL